jgi:hypothetical protein
MHFDVTVLPRNKRGTQRCRRRGRRRVIEHLSHGHIDVALVAQVSAYVAKQFDCLGAVIVRKAPLNLYVQLRFQRV